MVIDINTYKNNKEVVRELSHISDYFMAEYPNKTWGWVGLTALLFAQMAIEKYVEDNDPDPAFYPALKSMLWNFQNKVNEMQKAACEQRAQGGGEKTPAVVPFNASKQEDKRG